MKYTSLWLKCLRAQLLNLTDEVYARAAPWLDWWSVCTRSSWNWLLIDKVQTVYCWTFRRKNHASLFPHSVERKNLSGSFKLQQIWLIKTGLPAFIWPSYIHLTYGTWSECFSKMARWWSEGPKHVAIKINETKYIVVLDSDYKQIAYLVTH